MAAKYRHEYKYLVDQVQLELLRIRAVGLLRMDPHADDTGHYLIRSLYFDDWWDSCYYENEAGTDPRAKYRIRIYNGNSDNIVLEKKSKVNGMTNKVSAKLTKDICVMMMNGNYPSDDEIDAETSGNTTLKTLILEMKNRSMIPKVIVQYCRMPLISELGNVRVTFDKNISTSNEIQNFLDKEINVRPIMELGQSVLEVKWDEYLPDYIKQCLQLNSLRRTSYSKFYLCRRYNEYGGIRY